MFAMMFSIFSSFPGSSDSSHLSLGAELLPLTDPEDKRLLQNSSPTSASLYANNFGESFLY